MVVVVMDLRVVVVDVVVVVVMVGQLSFPHLVHSLFLKHGSWLRLVT